MYRLVVPGLLGLVFFTTPGLAAVETTTTSPTVAPVAGPEALRAVVLAWLREDAEAARAAGQADLAATQDADLAALEARPMAPAPAGGPWVDLLPPLPPTAANPIRDEALKRVGKLVQEARVFPKGPDGGQIRGPEGWVFPTRSDQLLLLVQAFCHPQSPRAGDPLLVRPILRRLAAISEYLVPGHPVLGDFGCADNFADAWLILRSARPDIVPPGLAARMEAGLKVNSEHILTKWPKTYFEGDARSGVINMDSRRLLCLAATYRLFGDPAHLDVVKTGMGLMARSFLPDGATMYAEGQNEAFSYHSLSLRALLRLGQILNLPEAEALVAGSRWYYPLSVEPGGVAEWATASCWHHYWNTSDGAEGALMVAALTGCGHNARIARQSVPRGDLWLASFHRDLTPLPAPDRYLVHDRNIGGPRGRCGTWSWAGSARDFRDDHHPRPRGRSSYVGAMVLTGTEGKWPLSAALQDVGVGVRTSAAAVPDFEMGWIREIAGLATRETTASLTSATCAALGADNQLSGYSKPVVAGWRQRQSWIFTPERLLGLVTLTAEDEVTAHDLLAHVMLVSGRASWGTRQDLVETGPKAYTFGGLAVTFHDHTFTAITPQVTDVMSGSATHGKDQTGKSLRLILSDRGLGALDQSVTYPKGTTRSLLIEIRPAATAPARDFRRIPDERLLVTELTDDTGTYRLAYNPTAEAVPWRAPGRPGAHLHQQGEAYRPAWIGGEPSVPPSPWKAGGIPVAGNGLVLVEEPRRP